MEKNINSQYVFIAWILKKKKRQKKTIAKITIEIRLIDEITIKKLLITKIWNKPKWKFYW